MPRPTRGEVYYRGGRLWIRFQAGGRRIAEAAGVDTENEARMVLYRRIAEETKGRAVLALRDAPIGTIVDTWIKVEGRRYDDERVAKRFLAWLGAETPISKLGAEHFAAYAAHYMEKRKATTARVNLFVMSAFVNWARRYGYAVRDFKIAWPRGKSESPAALGDAEAASVLESVRGHAIFEPFFSLVFSGLRAAEAIEMTWERIDRHSMTMMVPTGKTAESAAVVPIFGQLAEWVSAQPPGVTGFLVPLETRNYMAVYHRIKRWNRDNEIKLPNPHRCRHTIATSLLKKGVPLLAVSKLLRHASPQVTATVYVHADAVDFRREFERASERRDSLKE